MDMSKKKTFQFEFVCKDSIMAENLNDAIRIFHEKYPHVSEDDITHISKNGKYMADTFSKETDNQIWYEPGCVCGKNDCIHDPMDDIARNCSCQTDMTDDKWEECTLPDPLSDKCYDYDSYHYNNECK